MRIDTRVTKQRDEWQGVRSGAGGGQAAVRAAGRVWRGQAAVRAAGEWRRGAGRPRCAGRLWRGQAAVRGAGVAAGRLWPRGAGAGPGPRQSHSCQIPVARELGQPNEATLAQRRREVLRCRSSRYARRSGGAVPAANCRIWPIRAASAREHFAQLPWCGNLTGRGREPRGATPLQRREPGGSRISLAVVKRVERSVSGMTCLNRCAGRYRRDSWIACAQPATPLPAAGRPPAPAARSRRSPAGAARDRRRG